MNTNFQAYTPTKIVFGSGELNNLHEQSMPGKKAMVVISNGKSTKENGSLEKTVSELKRAGVASAVFDRVEANPLKSTVMAGAAFARANQCDFIVALGGGSVMDASKGMAAMATSSGDVWDYISGGTGKAKPLEADPLPLVCIATTAGTGSEVDAYGVITNNETNEKIGFGGDDRLFPVLAVVDPELMVSIPAQYTAYQGFDALFHSTEVMISKGLNPYSKMVASTAIENIAKYLPRAVKDGKDLEARERVAFASTLSGLAMVLTSTTAEHSLEHAMSAYHQDLPHGAGLIMISKAFYEFFVDSHACDDRFIDMARLMGVEHAERPGDFVTALAALQNDCGVGALKMSDYGIKPEEFETLARNARETMGGLYLANPSELSDKAAVEIFQKSYR